MAKDGVYPLHEPIVSGQQFGVDVRLVVGEQKKVEALTMMPDNLPDTSRELIPWTYPTSKKAQP